MATSDNPITLTSGDDTLNNTLAGATILALDGNDSVRNSVAKVSIDAGEGKNTIENSGYRVTINGGAGYDSISNAGSKVTINAGAGNDYIANSGSNVTIHAGKGIDRIYNDGNYVTINAGAGNNSINSSGKNVLVLVNGNRNTVQGNVTITTGAGNSTLTGDRDTQIYQYVGGNDVITNYSHEDVIHIASGNLDSYSFDGGDLIFHIGNGSMRLKNMTNHAITVKDSKGKTTTQIYGTGYSGQQVIKNFVKTTANSLIDSKLRLDEAIKACSPFNSMQEVIDKMVADYRAAGDGDTFLRDYCGIIQDNEDNGSAIGWDAGGLQMKNIENLMPSVGDASYPDSTTFTIRGVTITVPEKSTLTENNQSVVQAVYSWYAEDAIKLVEETYGMSFDGISMRLYFFDSSVSNAAAHGGGGGIGIQWTNYYFPLVFAHEMTHVAQAHIFNWSYWTNYMIEGMADLTGGKVSGRYTLNLNPDKLEYYLDLDKRFASSTPEYGYMYFIGYTFWRYLMKQASNSYDSSKSYAWKDGSSIVGTSAAELLTGSGKNQTISAGKGNDTITAYGEKTKIFGEDGNDYILISSIASGASVYGGAGNDSLIGGAGNDSLNGGVGNDSIYSGAGNDTLSGGAGNDIFFYESGNDFITDYNAEQDRVYIVNGPISKTALSGSDVVFTIGKGTLTLKNAKSKTLNVIDDLTLTNSSESTVTIGWAIDKVDATKRTVAIKIVGNELNNSIVGGSRNDSLYGGTGNDTLDGGAGNDKLDGGAGDDSLWGNAGNDKLNGGAGNDTLTGGTGNDKLDGSAGNDNLTGGAGNDSLNGGIGDDGLNGSKGNDTLIGGEGNDKLDGSTGDDKLYGGAGNDTLWGGDGNDTLSGYTGDDILIGNEGNDSLNGGQGNDTLSGYTGDDILIGDEGNDSLNGGQGNDKLDGSAGNDSLSGGAGNDKLNGGKNNDTLIGGEGNDKLDGSIGNDTLDGGTGNDSLSGGAGNDILIGGAGNDTLSGGAGNDIFYYETGNDFITDYNTEQDRIYIVNEPISKTALSGFDVVFTIGKGTLTLKNAKGKTLNVFGPNLTLTNSSKAAVTIGSAVEKVDATKRTAAIKIVGNELNNSIVGGSRNDSLYGDAGNDTLDGGGGNDKLDGGAGDDTLDGGGGYNRLNGGKGNDNLIGGDNSDTLDGSTGDDKLYGGWGDDSLNGGAGNDSLWGDVDGNDTLWGDSGKDIFVYKPDNSTDKIMDYWYGEGDMLKILKSNGKEGGTFKSATFNGDTLTLAVDGGGAVIFDNVNAGDKININSKTYTISGKTLK